MIYQKIINIFPSNPYQCGAVHKVRHAIFDQFLPPSPMSHFVTHLGIPLKVRHTSRTPRFLVVQKARSKNPCTKSLSMVCGVFVRGFCSWFLSGNVLSGVVFVRSPFCQNPSVSTESLTSLSISRFICMTKIFLKCDVTCSGTPPPITDCQTFSDPLPLERDVLYERPQTRFL